MGKVSRVEEIPVEMFPCSCRDTDRSGPPRGERVDRVPGGRNLRADAPPGSPDSTSQP